MTADHEKNEGKPPTHGNSGEGTASIVPHLPASGQPQPPAVLPKFEPIVPDDIGRAPA